jgi:hypothetical protein
MATAALGREHGCLILRSPAMAIVTSAPSRTQRPSAHWLDWLSPPSSARRGSAADLSPRATTRAPTRAAATAAGRHPEARVAPPAGGPAGSATDAAIDDSPDGTAGPADDAAPRGCGWFDSSLDLRDGLLVQEHDRVDALAEVLPAAHWLAFELGVSPGAPGGFGADRGHRNAAPRR